MDSSTNAPFVSTQADGSTATQVDNSTATHIDDAAVTQAEATDGELPPVPPSIVSKTSTGNGRKKSLVWNHFEKVKVDEGVTMAVCNYCKKSYHADSKSCGTSNLLAHVTICPKNPNREDKGQKTLAFEPKNDGDEGFKLVSTTFSVEASRKALVEMIIIDELPFRCVKGYRFKKYVTTLQSKLRLKDIPSRQTVARDVIGIYNSEREKLRKSLKGCRGLKEIDASVARVSEAVRHVKSSPNRNQTFRNFMERGKEDSGGLGSPCMSDFQNCRAFVTLLRLFYNATKKFSSSFCILFIVLLIPQMCKNQVRVRGHKMVGDASDPYVIVHSRYDLFLEAEQSVGCSNEVEKYLAENCDGRRDVNFEVLGWWKDNSSRYPMLSKLAKDVLVVPVSTVASESTFSTGGRIFDPFRSSLSPLMVQNLVCAQNWLQAKVPISHRKSRDEVEALEEEFHDLCNMFKFLNL
ncbi:hypothetical protein SO802_016105 [Lithocarpus litseifolius]|uniref:BED-type domain-containing protein n=1 Tax=Lithocarpus litseifolius TaxID=425828 RepID=A0AAW2CW73_9ROSI